MKSPIKKVNVGKEKFAVIHVCTEKEQINRLSQILVGNGNPKDGYVYKVMQMSDEMTTINSKLTGISAVVNELHNASIGTKAIEKSIKEKRNEFIKVASFIVGALALVLTAYFSYKDNQSSKISIQKLEDFGVPVIINPRGAPSKLAPGDSLKFYRNGEFKNGIRDSQEVKK